jgi:hypothetical protein
METAMSAAAGQDGFYAPDAKELGLGICHVLEQAGGQLTFARMAEVVGDFLQVPEEVRGQPRPDQPGASQWTYYLRWACSELRGNGFMARTEPGTLGMCALTEPGWELGRWAGRIYDGENPDLPDWVSIFLQPMFTRMRWLLEGGKRRKPPDYELCRWVRYCYLLNRAKLGMAVFNLILADHVAPALFKQAERQARVLKLRRQEQEGKSDQIVPDDEIGS